MKTISERALLFALSTSLLLTCCLRAQSAPATGALEMMARITPTAARPEPVRQFTFYILTRSYAEVAKEVEAGDEIVSRDQFIDDLKVSKELKAWLKAHDILDLTMPDLDRLLTPDDIIQVPEFLLAYQRSNSGGVTNGLPKPKFTEADKKDHPEKYEKLKAEYLSSLKKFLGANPSTLSGVELELDGVNPQRKWAKIHSDHRKRVERLAPDVAQTKYLAGKMDTDLEGHASLTGLPAGRYWISTLSLDADAGDTRLRWDVPITIQPGQTTRIELTNLNAMDMHANATP
ncbi:MAG: carboxypeptidase-like regulatory domain-containing protein [Candidatus Acidiferrum sp.]